VRSTRAWLRIGRRGGALFDSVHDLGDNPVTFAEATDSRTMGFEHRHRAVVRNDAETDLSSMSSDSSQPFLRSAEPCDLTESAFEPGGGTPCAGTDCRRRSM